LDLAHEHNTFITNALRCPNDLQKRARPSGSMRGRNRWSAVPARRAMYRAAPRTFTGPLQNRGAISARRMRAPLSSPET